MTWVTFIATEKTTHAAVHEATCTNALQTTNASKPCSISVYTSIRSSNLADPHPRMRGCGSARLDDQIKPKI